MTFFRLAKYDLSRNLLRRPAKWLAVSLLHAFLYLRFIFAAVNVFWIDGTLSENLTVVNQAGLSFGDGILNLTGGELPFPIESLADSIVFPIEWLLPHAVILYLTLGYTRNDLTRGGVQYLVRSGNRYLWWLSKCVWNVLTVLSCCGVGILTWYVLSAATGRRLDFSINPTFFSGCFDRTLPDIVRSNAASMLALCVLPALVCAAMSLLQMTLTLFIKPVFSYILICAYYAAGLYFTSPFLISNYAMSVRSSVIGLYNFQLKTGLLICLLVSAAAVCAGAVKMRKMDVINFL